MSSAARRQRAHDVHEHHELGFVRKYIFSTDHKIIGIQFLFSGLFFLVIGGLLAMVVRWQLGWPETPVPGLGAGSSSETERHRCRPSSTTCCSRCTPRS